MFGGLDLKSASSSDEKKKEDNTSAGQGTAAGPGSSAFSFIGAKTASSDATTATDSAPAPASAFSFMNNGGGGDLTQSAAAEEKPTEPSASSGEGASAFSFMSPSSLPQPEQASNEAPKSASSASAFSFMMSVSTSESSATDQATAEQPASSAFSFLGSEGTLSSHENASTVEMSAKGDLTPPIIPNASPQPAGTGITFGQASATSKKPIKRRTRTKVGAAAAATSAPSMSDATTRPSIPAPAAVESVSAPGAQSSPAVSSTRKAADEATQRAEAFMNTKQLDATKFPAITKTRSVEEEEILKAATAAAEEAQKMEKKKGFTGLGGLFRSRSGNTSTAPHSPAPAVGSNGVNHTSVTRVASASKSSDSVEESLPPPTETVADRLQKEQEEAKRAMAERQLQMLQKTDGGDSKTSPPATSLKSAVSAPYSLSTPSYEPIKVNPVPIAKSQVSSSKPFSSLPLAAKSPTDEFHEIMSSFNDMVVLSMEEVTRLRQQRIGLLEERFQTMAKERLAIQQKEHAETQQTAAAEAEDFELADRMGTIIEKHERERVEFASVLQSISGTIQQLDEQKDMVIKGVSKCFHDIRGKLEAFKAKQDENEVVSAKDQLKEFTRVSKQLTSESERLDQDLKHIERDEKMVEEEGEELEASISEQSGEFEKLQSEARAKLEQAEADIEELRQKLATKQRAAAELRTEIAGHGESILRVRVKFGRQIDRVKRKKMTIADSREEWETERKAYEIHKEEHDAKVKAHSDALVAREELIQSLRTEIEMADTFEDIVSKEMTFGAESSHEGGGDDGVAQLQADVVKCEAAVVECKERLSDATRVYSDLEAEIATLETRIPELEEAKKVAASRRDFKAAGKASKEAKESSARLKQCRDELQREALQQKNEIENEVKELEKSLEESRKIAHEKEKETGLASMRHLADHIKRLVATKKTVCSDKAHSIQAVAAFVLEEQIKALILEGQAFGEKFGGWDELMADCKLGATSDKDSEPAPDSSAIQTGRDEPIAASEESGAKEESSTDAVRLDDAQDNPPSSHDTDQSMARFVELSVELKQVEVDLETAVAEEDYEKAAELDEKLQNLLAEVETLNLSDTQMEQALANQQESSDPVSVPSDNANESTSEELKAEIASNDDKAVTTADDDDVGDDKDSDNEKPGALDQAVAAAGSDDGAPDVEPPQTTAASDAAPSDADVVEDENDI